MSNFDDDCPGCGSSLGDRQRKAQQFPGEDIPTGLIDCPHCGTKKCCLCDMGDDVQCISCEQEEDE
jgi:hypothetical protein